ncbi:MAG TPA: DUF2202 domain-containing protein [Nitratifractor sp.]|nr:DUF2202 domain-containing protein [Nitratifractor sp.]HHH20364.1 DUF2202 domain-containing protein [Nitratifractor sp.]
MNKIYTISLLAATALTIVGCGGSSSGSSNGNYADANYAMENLPNSVTDAIAAPKSTLSQPLKDSITYMYNEEKLAKDIYLDVYAIQNVQQLNNIASKSEVKHEEAVDKIAKKYNLDLTTYPNTDIPYEIAIKGYNSGEYSVPKITSLYNTLYEKGIQSKKDALEVGCIVEVTDINDLNTYISQSIASNADDVTTVFNFLRDGSYKHYWAFDKGLKNMGVSDGCCTLGADYCHNEYPQ